MFAYIKKNIITIREAIGIDVHLLEDNRMLLSGVHLKLIKGNVIPLKTWDRLTSIKELQGKINNKIPVVISLNGKGVLLRKDASDNSDNLINNLFPGSNPQDFFYTTHTIEERETCFYISRKSLVESVIVNLQKEGFRILSMSLGTRSIEAALPFMGKERITIITPTIELDIENQKVQTIAAKSFFEKDYTKLSVGEAEYPSSVALALGGAIGALYKPADRVASDVRTTAINYFQKDYVYYKLFQFAGWAVLCTTLGLLLINFFVFNHYFYKNKTLLQTNDLLSQQQLQSTYTNTQLDSSYQFFVRSGWNKTTLHSFFIDRIAALAPPSVKFTNLETAPLQETTGVSEYNFSNDRISISGVSGDPTQLETFSRAIRNIQGVHNASIKNYLYKADLNAAVFTLEVFVNQ